MSDDLERAAIRGEIAVRVDRYALAAKDLEQGNLSLHAYGLMSYLCGINARMAPTLDELVAAGPDDRAAVLRGLMELRVGHFVYPVADLDDWAREVIRTWCRERGMSQNALAKAVGKSSATMSTQLRGTGAFTLVEWQDLAVALGSDLEGLLEEAQRRMRDM